MSKQSFHSYYFSIPVKDRDAYCEAAGTTVTYVERIAGGFRLPSLGMAKRLVDASKGKTSFKAIIDTWEKRNGPL